ncbi:hypothetical protein M8332_07000 (plasmid) [Fructilactobacillus ixorae]|uniref:Uncharacterized protein n=1 Tax=Fructilactobacillus ixorae TaxID=1750535 RepID=A0ABY5C8Q2_9LACO|nr:hypothetical protein [Fructilactobacillus ixorae]USS93963.1 hypothetical protein M8332_07000 [Fructilactobacillus ixorae]
MKALINFKDEHRPVIVENLKSIETYTFQNKLLKFEKIDDFSLNKANSEIKFIGSVTFLVRPEDVFSITIS